MEFFALSPAPLGYSSVMSWGLCVAGAVLLLLSSVVRRMKFPSSVRGATRTWPALLLAYGVTGILLGVSAAEGVTFFAMPALAALWALLLIVTTVLHALFWKKRSYVIVPQERRPDPRDAYLPGKRR